MVDKNTTNKIRDNEVTSTENHGEEFLDRVLDNETKLENEEFIVDSKVKKLKRELSECQNDKRKTNDDLLRLKADFLNTKKRLESETKAMVAREQRAVIQSILPLSDSFLMAMADTERWNSVDESWRKGVESIHAQLQSIFSQYSVKTHTPLNEKFDPNIHEAVGEVEVNSHEKQDIIQNVVQPGYSMPDLNSGEIIIRPAKVIVGVYNDTKLND